ncbi:MAG: acetylxylan esterase [Kiritimatiellae bacterium]|nr:acetylxylan esterase [Kiritimatiellia bacterium]
MKRNTVNPIVCALAVACAAAGAWANSSPEGREWRLEWRKGGERPVVVIDFGPECEGGYPAFTAKAVEGAPVVRASYATHPDGLGDKGDFWYETRATYLGPSVDLPILPASVNRFDVFSVTNAGRYVSPLAQGLVRYVRLTLDTPGTAVTVGGFSLENDGVHATEPMVGTFECSDARLTAIWRMSVRTCELSAIPARTSPLHVVSALKPACDVWLGPSHAYLADGAKRDRLVWSGDLWWAQRNMYAAYGYDSPYMPGSIRMLAENRTPEGYVQACPYPESHGPLKSGDWGPFASDEFAAWFVPVAWDHVLHSGDRALAKEVYPVVKDLVAYLRGHCRADGIFEQRRETSKHASALDFGEASTHHRAYMNILDWKVYVDAARLAEWLGDKGRAEEWRKAADQLAASVRRVFWDAGKGRFRGAIETDSFWGEANGLALAAKFCTADEAAAVRKTLVRHQHGKFQALFVRGLYEYGYADDAVARIYEHGWDDVLDPSWKGPRLTSECMSLHTRGWGDEAHPDTAIAGILSNYVLGVEPTEPGYAKYSVKPRPSKGVTSASGIVPTPWGALQVSWRLEDGKPAVSCREWRLSPECRLEGNILTVSVPKGKAGGLHAAITKVDLARFEQEGFEATVRVRGRDVTVPPQPYNGVKFMFHYRDKFNGADQWPGATLPTGSFDWRMASAGREKFVGAEGGAGELVLGLQDSSGTVSFDLSTLSITEPRPHWPVTNMDHVAAYTPDVAARPRMRGVMSPARDVNEDDFKTLKSWGATLLRFQIVRNWHGINTNQDLEEFDRWLDGRLDNFDKVALPMAEKYGINVVLDLHVPPGGREPSGDMNMFYDAKYADHFVKTWRRIARRFRGRRGLYGYDLINEPQQRLPAAPGLDYWSLQRRAAEAVRAEDPLTPIIIESNGWDSPTTFRYLSPLTLTNVIYQVHMYSPGDYTHQRVMKTRQWSVAYPNAEKGWNADFMRDVLKPVREFQLKHKALIYVGEFSAVAWAPGAENYLRDAIGIFEEYGWDWSYHAFREWSGWSVEHEGEDAGSLRPSPDNPRRRALLEGFRRAAPGKSAAARIVGATDKSPVGYRVGETIAFTLTARGGKRVLWERTGDDGKAEKGEASAGAPVVVKTSLDRPGFVRLVARLVDESGRAVARFDGGAGAAVGDIRVDKPEPGDFDAFWARHRAELAKVPMDGAKCREVASGRADVKLYEVSVPCAGPRPATGFLSVPAKPGKYPAYIRFHGYNASWLPKARNTPKPDALPADSMVFLLSAHGYEFNRDEAYYKALRASCGSNGHDYAFDPVQNSDPEKAYFCGMTYRVMRGLEYLKSRPEWDGRTLVAEGGSQGGLQSIWAAALDHDVTECRPFVPWCCNIAGPTKCGRARGDWHMEWVPALGYYDAANMARRIPKTCRVTVTWAGLGDYICPPSGVMAFYNNLSCPRRITWVQGATHTYYPPSPQTVTMESRR